jgi:F-type H+-transporting ATPase subunit b
MACLILASAEGSGPSLTNLDFTLFVSTFVLFGLFALVLGRYGWKPLLKMIEERESSVRNAVEAAQRANAEAQALLARHQELLRDAGREREEIIKRAAQDAERLRADLVAQARLEAEGQLERARQEIQRETRRALSEVRAKVADLAVDAAAKIVTSSLTPEAQKKLAEEFIAGLPPLN